MKKFSLLQSQLGVLKEWYNDPRTTQYSNFMFFQFKSQFTIAQLETMLRKIIEIHPALSICLGIDESGNHYQYVNDVPLTYTSIIAHDEELEAYQKDFIQPFDLFNEPLTRIKLVCCESANYLFIDMHHTITDGTSMAIIKRNIELILLGKEVILEIMPLQDLVTLEQERRNEEQLEKEKLFYNQSLSGAFSGEFLSICSENPSTKVDLIRIPIETKKMGEFSSKHLLSLNSLFLSAIAWSINRYTREDSIALRMVYHGRNTPGSEYTTGMFVKTLPLAFSFEKGKQAIEIIRESKSSIKRALAHQNLSLGEILSHCSLPLPIGFAYQKGLDLYSSPVTDKMELIKSDDAISNLNITLWEGDNGAFLEIDYMKDLYKESDVRQFIACCLTCIEAIVDNPGICFEEIEIVSKEEQKKIIELGTGKRYPYDKERLFVHSFCENATRLGDKLAVVDCDSSISYRELDLTSNQLAHRLVELGIEPNDYVALMLPRRKEFIVAALATFKAGGAYLPLDSEYPNDRLLYMLEDSGASVLITTKSIYNLKKNEGVFTSKNILFMDELELNNRNESINLSTPEGLAYMIYTSGSTGKPKGVMIQHKALNAYLNDCKNGELAVYESDIFSCFASFSFDASVDDLWRSLFIGSTLHILSESIRQDLPQMSDYFCKNKVTISLIPTQMGMELINSGLPLSFRLITVGGEKLKKLRKTEIRVVNAYGPTEFTVASCRYIIDQTKEITNIPIGFPLHNSYSFVVDSNQKLLPRGVPGELCLAGEQISLGYWNRPELTAERFVNCPFLPNQKMYRTGDLVRWNSEGALEYLGRIDTQVKLRGYRIELGEIESRIAQYPSITDSVVEVKEVNGTQHLCAYYLSTEKIDEGALRAYLSESLTEYMVPNSYMLMEDFPMTPGGKVDRRALPIPEMSQEAKVAPVNTIQKGLFELLSQLLGFDDFGTTTNLVSVGLTSILAIRLSSMVQQQLGWKLATKDILTKPTIQQLAKLVVVHEEASKEYELRTFYPITENQRSIYVQWMQYPNSTQYNIPTLIKVKSLDISRLKQSIIQVVEAHSYLKMHFQAEGDDIVQLRRDNATIPIEIVCLEEMVADNDFFQQYVRPFDLLNDDLCRFTICHYKQQIYLFMDFHHTLFDGTSLEIFLNELKVAYQGDELHKETFTAYDLALEEQDMLKSSQYALSSEYYTKLLSGHCSTEYPVNPEADGGMGVVGELSVELPRCGISEYCRLNGLTENNYLIFAFIHTLGRLMREDNIQLFTGLNGRGDANSAKLLGMLVKSIPVVHSIQHKKLVIEEMLQLQQQLFSTFEHDYYPLTHLIAQHHLVPNIYFMYEGGILSDITIDNQELELISLELDVCKFPLSLLVYPYKNYYQLHIQYDTGKYRPEDAMLLLDAFRSFSINALTTQYLSEVSLIGANDIDAIINLSRGNIFEYDKGKLLVDSFIEHAARLGDKPAVVDCDSRISYSELNLITNQLAHRLIELGVKPNEYVALMLPRRKEFMIAALAVFKAGGAYVPLDSEYPNDRLLYMLEDSAANVLITTKNIYNLKISEGEFTVKNILFVDELELNCSNESVNLSTPEGIAYMIYTSGSTGKPKGVMIQHKALNAYLNDSMSGDLPIYESDVFSCFASFSFDASVDDLWRSIFIGGTLHILSESIRQNLPQMSEYYSENMITAGTMPTQIGMELINSGLDFPLRYLIMGGEKMKKMRASEIMLINAYGPTEFTVASCRYIVDQDKPCHNIPIGYPLRNTYSFIVDGNLHLLPRGVAGELCLAGDQIALGYWNRPELTAERFIDCPFLPNQKMYRTGDLVRWNSEGALEYLGRIDTQVKLRGYRIELGEIESRMASFPSITASVVEVKEINNTQYLCAYYMSNEVVDEVSLQTYLNKSLTEYMVPNCYMAMESFPMTPGGKVNRKALPLPVVISQRAYVPPTSQLEETICQIYQKLLAVEQVSIDDNFFAIGGTSIIAIKGIIEFAKHKLELQYGDLFKLKTPHALANFLLHKNAHLQEDKYNFSNYDYTAIKRLLANNRLNTNEAITHRPLGIVLLTGATGYLGAHLLFELLQSNVERVYCMLRKSENISIENRLKTIMMYYFSNTFEELIGNRIQVIQGDFTSPGEMSSLKKLNINTVINSAAMVKHFVADDSMEQANVNSVQNLIELSKLCQARLIHVSTYSIGGSRSINEPTCLTEQDLYIGQVTNNEYVRTKFTAERLILEAISKGDLDAKIMRVGNLMGREKDGEFQANFHSNSYCNSIKSFKVLKAFPFERIVSQVEFSPIDRVAESILLLSYVNSNLVVLHPYNNFVVNMSLPIRTLQQIGYPIELLSNDSFNERVEQIINDPLKSVYLQGLIHGEKIDSNLQNTPSKNDFTTILLARLGFYWNTTDATYMRQFIKKLDDFGFFDE